ncbi:hypothetical protein CORC01_13331 [Colletotrichum orchidophilum]|uniref:Xylanolytic transcriptional activator regulatory domain-containing protein n=1 Tax=Colletotrichum orchidophilum TaxID=1209926 RepID=A0A1G4AQA9_9PEZI|nr:uncharacterized protein CORC01_13331 [Colletotrichum orchidophilum]OHE91354.1 hypothetical protein CORC01_13331 [Colletotrichum orchidophilum]
MPQESSSRPTPRQARRTARLRLACSRCQRRKIRISNLIERVKWLENIVKERCPDINLSLGPSGDFDMDIDGDETFTGDSMNRVNSASPEDSLNLTDSHIVQAQPAQSLEPVQATQTVRSGSRLVEPIASSALSHEIGMVSLGSSQDPKYIGPSSGYFLARLMLTSNRQDDQAWPLRTAGSTPSIPTALVEAMHGPMSMPSRHHAKLLAENYFDVINCQFPVLHQPSFVALMDQMYESGIDMESTPAAAFQVYMVLALGSNMRLNVWYLNYQCIAAVLDLGLQRDINTNAGISLLEQEMRTRIFWVVFTLDRMIATMMGRPIGLRDEACDLRLPQRLEDAFLQGSLQSSAHQSSGRLAFSIHLFRLAKLNSEFKYVANSIVRDTPRYAYPAVIDINEWQQGILERLDEWYSHIPNNPDSDYIRTICQISCHSLRMLVLRPSPAIPNPSPETLKKCFSAAREAIHLFDHLYKKNLLIHTWNTCHSAVLSIITMLYCLKMVPEIARQTALDALMSDFSAGLGVLAATGEHWSGAKRCRDILDEMIRATVRWVKDIVSQPSDVEPHTQRRSLRLDSAHAQTMSPYNDSASLAGTEPPRLAFLEGLTQSISMSSVTASGSESFLHQDPFESFLANTTFGDQMQTGDNTNLDSIMRGLFDDFIPTYPSFA